jgi:hypothetical protein
MDFSGSRSYDDVFKRGSMSSQTAKRNAEFMTNFKTSMQDFLKAKQMLKELKTFVERSAGMGFYNENDVNSRGQELLSLYAEARQKVAKNITEATRVSDSVGIPTQLRILPPPLIGGYSRTLNVYQASIEEELPFDYEVPITQLGDIIDQTIWACERVADEELAKEVNPPSTLTRVPGALRKGFSSIFKTDIDKAILKWVIIVLIVAVILRLFGVRIDKIGELIASWFKK